MQTQHLVPNKRCLERNRFAAVREKSSSSFSPKFRSFAAPPPKKRRAAPIGRGPAPVAFYDKTLSGLLTPVRPARNGNRR